jgi:beta-glucosidase/6-phospho-beta-glucosidase/beta-galactosidase
MISIFSSKFHHYRFSISWPRVLVNGTVLNPKGIEYYNKLIDALLMEDIEPIATMFHWDLPQYIQDLGGLTNPIFTEYFEHYADVLYQNFGDRVKKWITFNEPHIFCREGYASGRFAPNVKASGVGEYLCAHHVLQAHAATYHLYKQKYFDKQEGQVGIDLNSRWHYPKDSSVSAELTERAQEFYVSW